jgi:acyl-CoA thioesterase-1
MVAKTPGIVGGAVVAVAATAFVGYRLAERRQRSGAVISAAAITPHAEWWHSQRHVSGELLYVAIGDSAAQGVGASVPARSYVGLLAERARAATGRTVRVINLSQSGGRVTEALTKQVHHLADLDPDVVTVAIGANDIGAHFDPAKFEREIDELYRRLPRHTIVADVPSFYFGWRERQVRLASKIIHRVADTYGLDVAPLHSTTRRQSAPRYFLNQVAADLFHPNDRGYAVWASAFFPHFDRRLTRGDGGLA